MISLFKKRKVRSLEDYFDIFQKIPMEIAVFDLSGKFIFINNYYFTNGIQPKEFLQKDEEYYFYRLQIDPAAMNLRRKYFERALKSGQLTRFTEKLYFTEKNRTFYYKRIFLPLLDSKNKKVIAVVLFGNNLTHLVLSQKELKYLAYHDRLTGLRNRDAFYEQLNQVVKEAARVRDMLSAILFIDLDNFKFINDTLGHDYGDNVLREAARRMVRLLRKSDQVFRLGGDEFTVLLRSIKKDVDAGLVAEKLVKALSEPYEIKDQVITSISPSIGISLIPNDGLKTEDLVKSADIAMYEVKNEGKAGYKFFAQQMTERSLKRLQIVNELKEVIEAQSFDEQFTMHYQPILASNGKVNNFKIIGVEALIRWKNPRLGNVSPAEFIPIAEESHLINYFNKWIIDRTLGDFNEISKFHNNGLYLSINVSPLGLKSEDFARSLQNALLENHLNPRNIQLEITETSLMDEGTSIHKNISALVGMGVELAIDDFGTGYASLNYLQNIPAQTIKIDRSYISKINSDVKNKDMIRAILAMGKSLNKNMVAEGVETSEHLEFLRQNDCKQFQGYLFSKPIDVDSLIDIFSKHNMEITLP
ncbi:putative bifunctional diguanylate cyclase/phosphodiesterase [Caldithrix abyssi]